MEIKKITNTYSVSGQISVADVESLAEQEVEILMCNRPDGEAPDQTIFADIAAKAKEKGIETVYIPFAGGALQEDDVKAFLPVLKSGKKIHGYCRTGNRSSVIFEAAKKII